MKEHLLKTLENSRTYTVAVVDAMPENLFSFKPADEVYAFGQMASHIAHAIQWCDDNYLQGKKTDWRPAPDKKTKADHIAYLNEVFENLRKTLSGIAIDDNVVQGFYATLDHITHHRGQAVTYLRCKGVVPPQYVC